MRHEAPTLDERMAERLRALRAARGWSLEALAERCGVSRATLSRLEKAEVSPTAEVLGRLCAAYGITMSRLLAMVEVSFAPLVRRGEQAEWVDPATGFRRRIVSPPGEPLMGEVIECAIPAGRRIHYDAPSRAGLEHHLVMLDGRLGVSLGDVVHDLGPGDCLRYRLHGPSTFETGETAARYLLAMM
ncbi:helix-turn-helix domain-containing protein [Acuticoccus mangrovi]|uniref:Helix-turn-helix transcriptional regulator n=1 Tax=Acuticoccus mangrovi TaxID=2796142 RepID=A0A934IGE0_9HYPH|nr:XRE family transcriptional regulator [Acuticoccus mangrovi]MBJ3776194.1 helix-turn-helix transcriptional regulator [Acuticoccus mangrovi]